KYIPQIIRVAGRRQLSKSQELMYFEVNNKSVTGVTSVIDGADLNIACSGFAEVRSIDGPITSTYLARSMTGIYNRFQHVGPWKTDKYFVLYS
ncbi:hypothetical protein AC596_17105, partial [Yersinia pestis subsp. microtus bv. Hissarica]